MFHQQMSPLIHIFQNNRQEGPFTAKQIHAMLNSGAVALITLAWKEGMAEWAPLNTVLTPTPPTLPVAATPPPPPLVCAMETVLVPSPMPRGSVGPKGVGGWLIFFCVGITIIGPLFTIGQMAATWHDSQDSFYYYPNIKNAIIWENISSALLLSYGFVVGCRIWSGDQNGRSIANKYLADRLWGFIFIECVALLIVIDLPSSVLSEAINGIYPVAIREVFFFLIWRSYFKNSKRVRNTYERPVGE
jgi:hypothetical protein